MKPTPNILIVDDDPLHLQLYGMIVEKAGLRGVPVLVAYGGLKFPEGEQVDAVLMDYRLGPYMTAEAAAKQIKERFPAAPVLLLSDLYDAPADTAPYVHGFVRKGSPEKLLAALRELVP
jgi:CheY-like chemotaxis protein